MKDFSICGTDCSSCGCYGNLCMGCNACEGKVFFVPEGKACPIYECAIHKNTLKNCGQCEKVPCSIWRSTRDPKYSDAEFEKTIEDRVNALRNM